MEANLLRNSDLCSRNCYFCRASYAKLCPMKTLVLVRQHRALLPVPRVELAECSEEPHMLLHTPPRLRCRNATLSHSGRPSACTLSVALLSLSTPQQLHPQFYNSPQCILLTLYTHHFAAFQNHIILPSRCMSKHHINLFLTLLSSGLAPFIPTYSLPTPKGRPFIPFFMVQFSADVLHLPK